MLEKVDLTRELPKAEYKTTMARVQERLRVLQRAAFEAQLPTAIVLEGWDAAGKGTLVGRLVEKLDPRGFRVWPTYAPTMEELYRPWLWRFWHRLPPHGEIAVFDRSWYGRVLVERIERLVDGSLVEQAYGEIRDFERALIDDGMVLVKLFLHISKKEQRRRFLKAERDPFQRWKIKPEDWRHHDQYWEYYDAVQEMLQATSTTDAPWTLVAANDRRTSEVDTFKAIIAGIERRLSALNKCPPPNATVGNLAARPSSRAAAARVPAPGPPKRSTATPSSRRPAPRKEGPRA